ncbi:FtsW/RodA/SpoVE family cell cycle protein [Bowdeniella massiliensis]|uniref:FtsW/RodA/SpoVE family cell cycle protein n=1 Tax=Bowdeniella massiliensis TaxID=2932264 RepID=UPI002027C531|nr:FtsW/RodA/SpoVE family cell cycle protein [Bowdeniella massiliensis]
MATVAMRPARSGRLTELLLLLPALALGLYAYVQVGLAVDGAVPARLTTYAAGFSVLAIITHLVVRWRAPYADPVILPIAVALNGIGLAMIARLDIAYKAKDPNAHAFASGQLQWTILGIALGLAVILLLRDHRTLRRFTYLSLIGGLIMLLLPLVPGLGKTINGSRIWIGVSSFSFQPGEIAKILLAIFFAGYLATQRDNLSLAGPKILGLQLPRIRDFGPILIAWGVAIAVLVFEKDLGSSLLFFGLFVAMLYVATERVSWIIIGLGMFLAGVILAGNLFSHVYARYEIWRDPLSTELYNRSPGGSFQLVQGLFGMAQGGLMGTGWGYGHPELVYAAHSDSITASLGEELGLTGLIAILLLYLILALRAIRIGLNIRDAFGKLLCGGLGFILAFQVFVVVGGITRVIPLTGLTLPFLAQGGSSLIANWMIIGLLLRMSNGARQPGMSSPTPQIVDGPLPPTIGDLSDDQQRTEEVRLR